MAGRWPVEVGRVEAEFGSINGVSNEVLRTSEKREWLDFNSRSERRWEWRSDRQEWAPGQPGQGWRRQAPGEGAVVACHSAGG